MKHLLIIFCTAFIAFFLATTSSFAADYNLSVNVNTKYQTVTGFGAADAWLTQPVGRDWNVNVREQLARWLFSDRVDAFGNPQGIGLSMWRVNLGAGSADQEAASINSQIRNADRRTECFLDYAGSGTYNWNKQMGHQYFFTKARDYGITYQVLFANSPPVNMTYNGKATKTNGTGLLDLGVLWEVNLKNRGSSGYANNFADFMTTVIKHFKDEEDVYFSHISPINEPQGPWTIDSGDSKADQEGSSAQNAQQKDITIALNTSLVNKGLSTKIVLTEAYHWSCLYSNPATLFGIGKTDTQLDNFFNSTTGGDVRSLSNLPREMSAHSYNHNPNPFSSATTVTNASIRESRYKAWERANSFSSGPIALHQSEFSALGDNVNDGDIPNIPRWDVCTGMDLALYLSKVIYADLTYAQVKSWSYWTAIGDEWNHRYQLIQLLRDHQTILPEKNLWVMGNYSFFIRPGYQRIDLAGGVGTTSNGVEMNTVMGTAYVAPDNSRVVAVLTNITGSNSTTGASKTVNFTPPTLPGKTLLHTKAYCTDKDRDLVCLGVINPTNFTLPARSVTTLVFTYEETIPSGIIEIDEPQFAPFDTRNIVGNPFTFDMDKGQYFGIKANPAAGGVNATSQCVKYITPATAYNATNRIHFRVKDGYVIVPNTPAHTFLHLMCRKFSGSNSVSMIEVEDRNGVIIYKQEFIIDGDNTWQNFVFAIPVTTNISISRIHITPTKSATANATYYFDEIKLLNAPDPNPAVSAPAITSYSPTAGGIGEEITITGSNFGTLAANLKVSVGGFNAPIMSITNTQIKCMVMPFPGPKGAVTLTSYDKYGMEQSLTFPTEYTINKDVSTLMPSRQQGGDFGPDPPERNTEEKFFFWDIRGLERAQWLTQDPKEPNLISFVNRESGHEVWWNQIALNLETGTMERLTNFQWDEKKRTVTWSNDGNIMIVATDFGNNDGGPNFAAAKAYLRSERFRTPHNFLPRNVTQCNTVAVHPINGEVYYNTWGGNAGGPKLYRYELTNMPGIGQNFTPETAAPAVVDLAPLGFGNINFHFQIHPTGAYGYMIFIENHCIYRVNYNFTSKSFEGTPTLVAGTWNQGVSDQNRERGYAGGDGNGASARMRLPNQGAFVKNPAYAGQADEYDFYFTDLDNHRFRVLKPNKDVVTIAGAGTLSKDPGGNNNPWGFHDGDRKTTASFDRPDGLIYDEVRQCFYIGDWMNHTIRVIPRCKISNHITFSVVENTGGTVAAKLGGVAITSGKEVDTKSPEASAQVVFTASPANDCYIVKEWKVNGETVVGNTGLTHTVTGVTQPINVTVEYAIADYIVDTPSKTWTEYCGNNIIFKESGQLAIPGTQTVNGVIKIEKTFPSKQWYAIGFPFDIASVSCTKGGIVYNDLETYNPGGGPGAKGDYWLRTYDALSDVFEDYLPLGSKTIRAGGYAIQVPEAYVGATFTFTSNKNATISNSNSFNVESSSYKLTANPSVVNKSILLSDADYYYILDINDPSNFGLWTSANNGRPQAKGYVSPFESIVIANGIALSSLRTSLEIDTPNKIDALNASDQVVAVHYYNLLGVRVMQLQRGQVYLVHSIYESGKTSVVKQLIR